jgi:regulatory protein
VSTSIQRIESVGPDAKARRLIFEDASEPRVTSAAILKLLALEAGCAVDMEQLRMDLAENEPRLARERALQLLGYRERSCAELRQRLHDNGYPRSVVNDVVDRFCEVELIDDARFASAWVRSRVSAGYGRRRVARELAEKGIDDALIQSALEEEMGDDELRRAMDSLRGRRPRDAKERERLIRRLVSRGFELRVALEAVDADPQD